MDTEHTIQEFFESAIPKVWFDGNLQVRFDNDEILCIGPLADDRSVQEFRESTRTERVAIATEAEARFRRKVSWGVEANGMTTLFTTQSAPITTRLRLPERAVLDTLVDAGVARSRSDALGWCVKLVGRHQSEWIDDLRDALVDVGRVRAEGPTLV